VDLFADPDDEQLVITMIQTALRAMKQKGMMTASCVLTSKSPFLRTLKRQGFLFPLRRFPFIVRLNSPGGAASTLDKVADWHITLGDGDFV
jgi:hypothetical protein